MIDAMGLKEALNILVYFGINVAIVCLVVEVVFLNELFEDHSYRDVDPF